MVRAFFLRFRRYYVVSEPLMSALASIDFTTVSSSTYPRQEAPSVFFIVNMAGAMHR